MQTELAAESFNVDGALTEATPPKIAMAMAPQPQAWLVEELLAAPQMQPYTGSGHALVTAPRRLLT